MDENSDSPGVYFLVNPDSKEVYIGSSGKVLERKSQHDSLLRNNRHPNKRLQRSYNQNGSMAFVALTLPDREAALNHEQALLDASTGEMGILNISRNARYCRVPGLRHSEETKAKIGAASRGNKNRLGSKLSEEQKQKLREASTGVVFSPERCEKIRQSKLGLTHTDETKLKISQKKTGVKQDPEIVERRAATLRGKPLSEQNVQALRESGLVRAKSVSIDGVIYSGINEAARTLTLNPGTIHNRVNSDNFPTWFYETE